MKVFLFLQFVLQFFEIYRLVNQSSATQESLRVGVGSAELAILHHGILAATHFEQMLERLCCCGVKDSALLEKLECIGVENFGPQVGIVAHCIATVEHVREVACAVAVLNFGDESNLGAQLLLEFVAVEIVVVCQAVHAHVEQCRCHKLDSLEARIEVRRLFNLLDKFVGDSLAALVVLSVALEYLGLHGPMLVNLREELHKVVFHVCAAHRGIVGLCHQPVQRVAELVEQCQCLVDVQQRGCLARCGGEVTYVHNHGAAVVLAQVHLIDEICHPRTRALRLTGEIVAVEDSKMLFVLVEYLPHLHAVVVQGNVVAFRKVQTEQSRCAVECTVAHILELEVGLNLILIERVFSLAQLLCVVHPVPACELETTLLAVD